MYVQICGMALRSKVVSKFVTPRFHLNSPQHSASNKSTMSILTDKGRATCLMLAIGDQQSQCVL